MGLAEKPVSIRLRALAGDLFVFYEVFLDRVYHIPASILPKDDVRLIVDCGANVGLTSLFLAGRYPNATVIAVEPHPDNYALLKFNTAHEPRITPIHACIVGVNCGDRFISMDKPAWGNTTNESGDGAPVPAKTIDQLLVDHPGERIDLLKVDVEGAERELFASAGFLRRTGFVIIELHGAYGMDEFRRDLAPFHFDAHAPDDNINMVTARPASSQIAHVS